MLDKHRRVKVSIAFHIRDESEIRQRKQLFSFKATTSLLKIYHEVSGESGSRALWPREFREQLHGGDVFLCVRFCGEGSDTSEWYLPVPQTRLWELLAHNDDTHTTVVQVLFRLVDRSTEDNQSQTKSLLAVSNIRMKPGKDRSSKGFHVGEMRTFVHVVFDDDGMEVTRNYAESDPGSSCSSWTTTEPSRAEILSKSKDIDGVEMFTGSTQLQTDRKGEHQGRTDHEAPADCQSASLTCNPRHDLADVHLPFAPADSLESPIPTRCRLSSQNAWRGDGIVKQDADGASRRDTSINGSDSTKSLESGCSLSQSSESDDRQPCNNTAFCDDRRNEGAEHLLFHAVMKAIPDEVERMILDFRVNVGAVDVKGSSAMHFWARSTVNQDRLMAIGMFLVRMGANVSAPRAIDFMTPLHHVIVAHNNRRGWWDFHKAVFLIRCGADLSSRTVRGQTPLDLLRMDRRASTQTLARCLRAAAAGITELPGCATSGCGWWM